jgi:hypothetical protein
VTAVSAPDVNGVVTVSHTDPGVAATFSGSGASLFNMGPLTSSQKVRYDLTGAFVLRSTSLFKADGTPNDDTSPPPNPLASNVVNMKLLYGIDTTGSGALTWVNANTSLWTPLELMSTTPSTNLIAQLKTLKAVRIGLIVRGEQWDRDAPDVSWTLFGGHLNGGYEGTFPSVGGNFRYRTYETIIPIRNELWNAI